MDPLTDNDMDANYELDPSLDSKERSPKNNKSKPKRTSVACIRCRTRHIRCPGGDPCKKCQLAKTKCEYVEADKKIVVSMKYLSKLHDNIARLKKENATLRANLKDKESNRTGDASGRIGNSFAYNSRTPHHQHLFNEVTNSPFNTGEVIQPTLDKYGRLIQSRTGEKVYVGSSSMTLFGLEIQNMVPTSAQSPLQNTTNALSPLSTTSEAVGDNREAEVMEEEGNAYRIVLAKTNTRPGLSINFTLPSYSYAMLLVDNFINYNDGCFYFFNEGLVKRYIMNLYSGNTEENKKIMRRNIKTQKSVNVDENSIKKDCDDDTILETMWFCKILLIFATGEMYLGTESDVHIQSTMSQYMANPRKKAGKDDKQKYPKNTLPGSKYFYQASELFTGLFASGAIDNITKDGGIEAVLLYAFYLQVADCTISSYFYFGLALRSALILGWHVDAEKDILDRFELEHRRRLWWTVYMYERMLSSKAGLPLSFSDDSVSTGMPSDIDLALVDYPMDENDVKSFYIFPSAEYINNCLTITQINAIILSCLYTKQPTINILPVVSDLVHRLMNWKNNLPEFLKVDFHAGSELKISRLIVNLMTEYFQGINLAVRPLLFHFATKKLKELQYQNNVNKYVDLSKYSKNIITLLNASFQASINTIRSIWALLPDNMVALFGWMDREYLFTSALTLILFNSSFGLHEATKEHLDHALTIFTLMKKLGNYPAALRRAQLLKLVSILDFNGVMRDLLLKHDDEGIFIPVKGAQPDVENDSHNKTNLNHQHLEESGKSNIELRNDNDFELLINVNFDSYDVNALDDMNVNSEAIGIEGFTHFSEEQKLWNEITNDAVWLQRANKASPFPEENPQQKGLGEVLSTLDKQNQDAGAYGDIVNDEFHDLINEYSTYNYMRVSVEEV